MTPRPPGLRPAGLSWRTESRRGAVQWRTGPGWSPALGWGDGIHWTGFRRMRSGWQVGLVYLLVPTPAGPRVIVRQALPREPWPEVKGGGELLLRRVSVPRSPPRPRRDPPAPAASSGAAPRRVVAAPGAAPAKVHWPSRPQPSGPQARRRAGTPMPREVGTLLTRTGRSEPGPAQARHTVAGRLPARPPSPPLGETPPTARTEPPPQRARSTRDDPSPKRPPEPTRAPPAGPAPRRGEAPTPAAKSSGTPTTPGRGDDPQRRSRQDRGASPVRGADAPAGSSRQQAADGRTARPTGGPSPTAPAATDTSAARRTGRDPLGPAGAGPDQAPPTRRAPAARQPVGGGGPGQTGAEPARGDSPRGGRRQVQGIRAPAPALRGQREIPPAHGARLRAPRSLPPPPAPRTTTSTTTPEPMASTAAPPSLAATGMPTPRVPPALAVRRGGRLLRQPTLLGLAPSSTGPVRGEGPAGHPGPGPLPGRPAAPPTPALSWPNPKATRRFRRPTQDVGQLLIRGPSEAPPAPPGRVAAGSALGDAAALPASRADARAPRAPIRPGGSPASETRTGAAPPRGEQGRRPRAGEPPLPTQRARGRAQGDQPAPPPGSRAPSRSDRPVPAGRRPQPPGNGARGTASPATTRTPEPEARRAAPQRDTRGRADDGGTAKGEAVRTGRPGSARPSRDPGHALTADRSGAGRRVHTGAERPGRVWRPRPLLATQRPGQLRPASAHGPPGRATPSGAAGPADLTWPAGVPRGRSVPARGPSAQRPGHAAAVPFSERSAPRSPASARGGRRAGPTAQPRRRGDPIPSAAPNLARPARTLPPGTRPLVMRPPTRPTDTGIWLLRDGPDAPSRPQRVVRPRGDRALGAATATGDRSGGLAREHRGGGAPRRGSTPSRPTTSRTALLQRRAAPSAQRSPGGGVLHPAPHRPGEQPERWSWQAANAPLRFHHPPAATPTGAAPHARTGRAWPPSAPNAPNAHHPEAGQLLLGTRSERAARQGHASPRARAAWTDRSARLPASARPRASGAQRSAERGGMARGWRAASASVMAARSPVAAARGRSAGRRVAPQDVGQLLRHGPSGAPAPQHHAATPSAGLPQSPGQPTAGATHRPPPRAPGVLLTRRAVARRPGTAAPAPQPRPKRPDRPGSRTPPSTDAGPASPSDEARSDGAPTRPRHRVEGGAPPPPTQPQPHPRPPSLGAPVLQLQERQMMRLLRRVSDDSPEARRLLREVRARVAELDQLQRLRQFE